jgi:hypothetical protein
MVIWIVFVVLLIRNTRYHTHRASLYPVVGRDLDKGRASIEMGFRVLTTGTLGEAAAGLEVGDAGDIPWDGFQQRLGLAVQTRDALQQALGVGAAWV